MLDTESSGLDYEDGCEITEICAKAINYWDLSDHHAGMFQAYIRPQRPEKAQPGALAVIKDGWTKACDEGLEPKVVWQNFHDWCESVNDQHPSVMGKPIVYAFNQDHDRRFIIASLKEYKIVKKDPEWGWNMPWAFMFDAMQSFYELFGTSPNVQNLKLDTALDMLGLKRGSGAKHTAQEDVDLFTQMTVRILKFQREAYKRMRVNQ